MSGPIRAEDAGFDAGAHPEASAREGRAVSLGNLDVVRVLPTKGRRTVGPWCFVDLITPADAADPDPMEIGPHPHMGLATVTWLFEGEAEHADSLDTLQLIRPGELNLMWAGRGIAHAELGLGRHLSGAQMWLAQPEETRHGSARFEHHKDLPAIDLGSGRAIVFIGSLEGASSPASADSETVGADLLLEPGSVEVPVDPAHEHAVVPIDEPVVAAGTRVDHGAIGLIPPGRASLCIETIERSRLLLLGGAPLGERVYMWWNFVARDRDEVTAAWRSWDQKDTDRFGPVPTMLQPIEAPRPPWLRAGGG